jgi:hypothetical protein
MKAYRKERKEQFSSALDVILDLNAGLLFTPIAIKLK